MKQEYNFDTLTQRRDTASVKWDLSQEADMLPMWVADMDFPTVPAVTEAIIERARSGVFGYVSLPDSYFMSLNRWFNDRHGWNIEKEDVMFFPGIVPALSAIVDALVPKGSGVIFQTPAYNCFFSAANRQERRMVLNPLLRKQCEDGFTFEIDFNKLEEVASDADNKLLILCNPHNPTGRVWTRQELETVRDICRRNSVTVLSDEIHCELIHPGREYIPYATIDADSISCCSPSKAFNIAGLQVSNIVTRNAELRAALQRVTEAREVCNPNTFGIVALQAAYDKGGEWLDALNEYLYCNYCLLRKELLRRMPMLKICCSEATYLAWVDVSALELTSDRVEEIAKVNGHVWINSGKMYGGEGYIRINYACQRQRMLEGLDRFCKSFGF